MKKTNWYNFLRALKAFLKTFSWKRARFIWYLNDLTHISNYDDDLLKAQLLYFAHHLEKAIKHNNWQGRGEFKREKLSLLQQEAQRRNFDVRVLNWITKIINYYDNLDNPIYLKKIEGDFVPQEKLTSQEWLSFLSKRATVRFWQQREVEDEIIKKILNFSLSSPFSCNRQTVRFKVVKNTLNKIEVGESNNNSMLKKAPVIIYVLDDERFFAEKYGNALDVGSVCSLIQLAAHTYGLGSCWVYFAESYPQEELKNKYRIPDHYYIYSLILLGYPLDNPQKPPRFKVDEYLL